MEPQSVRRWYYADGIREFLGRPTEYIIGCLLRNR